MDSKDANSSRKRTRKEAENEGNDQNDLMDEPSRKKQKIDYDSNRDEDEEEEDEEEETEDDDDLKEEWNEIDWFCYYQYLYDTEHEINPILYDRQQYIYKLQRNRDIISRNGRIDDFVDLAWNVYICNKLNVDQNKINILKQELIDLAETNNDWRNGEPIQNIIDPDLYVYKYYDKNKQTQYIKEYIYYDEDSDNINKWIQHCQQKGYFQRAGYQWLATEFVENKQNDSIQITSSIHNISPRSKYENIYKGIEYIFERMLPLFNRYTSFKNRKSDSFQVIVKSQRYCIEDGTGYKGHWHKEGLTENIIIAGLYYFEISDNLQGGRLKFRNTESLCEGDDCSYCDMDHRQYNIEWDQYKTKNGKSFGDKEKGLNFEAWLETEQQVDINEGTAIVFDNKWLIHRVRMLKNKMGDNQKRYRSFLAFFIVDPDKYTNISTNIYSTLKREDYVMIIIEYGCNEMPFDIAMIICEYGVCGMTLNEAKEIREKDIEIKKNTKTKGKFVSICNDPEYPAVIKSWYQHPQCICNDNVDEFEWESTSNSEC